MRIFNFKTYEAYFDSVLQIHQADRGYKSRLAGAAKVHPSYITRISSGTASITPDQAVALAEFWEMTADEKEYFLWLVLKGRAGDVAIKRMADEKLATLKKRNDDLATELSAEKIQPETESEYYMNWIYSAVHMLLTLPIDFTLEQISRRLGVSIQLVESVVGSLKSMGLAKAKTPQIYKATKKNIHLSNQSWVASLQHRNWRVVTAERVGRPGSDDLRYTGVHSLSKNDLEKLREKIREFLLQTDRLIRPSPEETVCVLCVDLFEL